MALGFGRSKNEDVLSLIAAKDYGRAIEALRAQLKKRGASTTLRKQLADVLELSGKIQEAVALLLPLADQFAREGFAAKAVAVLKKIQKMDPGRRDVEERLARVIEEKQREAVVLPFSRAPEIGIEEIGLEPPSPSSALSAPAERPGAGPAAPPGTGGSAPTPAPPEPPRTPPPRPPAPPDPSPKLKPPPEPLPVLTPPFGTHLADAAKVPIADPAPPAGTGGGRAAGGASPAAPATVDEIEDYDLLYQADEEDEDEEDEVVIEVEALGEAPPMTDGAFADELMSLVDTVFQESPAQGAAAHPPATAASGSQIVVSPLFRDFAVDEMVAVIQGLKLLCFERGEVILREGSSGGSLYTLTSGRVRAFRKDPANGKQQALGDLKEGAFFGEMSILTGQPRMASVVALTRCELLELDRSTLDDITGRHPHVWDVLREFAEKRSPPRG